MRTWKKVAIGSTAVLVLAGAGVVAAKVRLAHRTPDWYAPDESTPAQRASAANRVEDTLARLYNWSAGRHARGADHRSPTSTPTLAEPATDAAFPLTFTDAQLNAFYDKWSGLGDRRATVEKYVKDPRIAVREGHVIVAGQARDMGVVLSLFLDPSVSPADGRVRLTLSAVMAGVVTLPDAFTAGKRAALERTLAASLPADQAAAALTPDGLANGPAATAAMVQMLLGVLRGRSTEPVIFVPVSPSPTSPLLPVRVSSVTAADHTLTMTARPVPLAERPALLAEIKRPDDPNPPADDDGPTAAAGKPAAD